MKNKHATASLTVAWVLALLVGLTAMGGSDMARAQTARGSLNYTFVAPDYQVTTGEAGFTTVKLDGFYSYGLPGDPQLPAAVRYLALPPFVPLESITLEISAMEQVDLPGAHSIQPAGAVLTNVGEGPVEDWGANAAAIVAGRNSAVYEADAYYPAAPVEIVSAGQMRKWRLVALRFQPVSFNPLSGRLRLAKQVNVTLHYDEAVAPTGATAELQDTLMDDRAATLVANFAEASGWYSGEAAAQPVAGSAQPGYAIITTEQIAGAAGLALQAFKDYKGTQGFNVMLVTESQYGQSGPTERPAKVRQWLQAHYLPDRILYVLLIGNPDPYDARGMLNAQTGCVPDTEIGDLPMPLTWPKGRATTTPCDRTAMRQAYPTDHFFADLTGNWDRDNNGLYGLAADYDLGGVDFLPEVYVGRIPVYQAAPQWADDLRHILEKTKSYETATNLSWRRSALLPMGFVDAATDSAQLGEDMKGFLDLYGFNVQTMYLHGNKCDSIKTSTQELGPRAVHTFWKDNPMGVVAMGAHGNALLALFNQGCGGDRIEFFNLDADNLNDNRPAIVFLTACYNGQPDDREGQGANKPYDSNGPGRGFNVAYALLRNGAVATVAATGLSNYVVGWTHPEPNDLDEFSFAYYFVENVVANVPVGQALFAVKGSPDKDVAARDNAMAFNLYGDPSLKLDAPRYSQRCAPAAGNILANFCFTNKWGWRFSPESAGQFALTAGNPFDGRYAAEIRVVDPASPLQLYQKGINLQTKTDYELSFAAYSSDGSDLGVRIHKHSAPFTDYDVNYGEKGGLGRVNLGTSWRWYTMVFTTPRSVETDGARLRFWFRPYAQAGTVYYIDRVVLRPISP